MPSLKPFALPLLVALTLASAPSAQEAPPEAPAAEAPAVEAPPAEAPAEAPAEDPAAQTPDPAAAADPLSDLDMGQPIDAAPVAGADPQEGEPYERETFGDWALRCVRAAEGPDPCQLYQLLLDDQGNAVAEISMFPLPPGGQAAAGATIVAPLETLLTEDLTLAVDGTAARRYPFTFCNRAGCVARVGFTAEEIAQFKRGNLATLSIVPAAAPDETVVLNISLTGFTAGYDSSEQVPPPAE